jgi:hypothetical protein
VQQHGSERDKASRGSDNADQQDYHQITIEQPVHHDGSEALVKWALVERLIGLALGAREVSEGAQAGNLFALIASARVQLAQAAKLGAGIVQLAAQLSPLGHDAFPRAVEARARWRAQRGAADRRRTRGRQVAPLFAPAMGLKKEQGERGRRRADLARFPPLGMANKCR